jgi:predicted SAM-dependent methyltransferase
MGNPIGKLVMVLRRDGLLRTSERAWEAAFSHLAGWKLSHLLGRTRNLWRLPALRRTGRGGKLNLGCGPDRRAGWINADLGLTGDIHLDAAERFPFPDDFLSLIFTEHLIEHLTEPQATVCLRECCRVLQPGGTIYVGTPDLGAVVAYYLGAADREMLEGAATASPWKYPAGTLPRPAQALNDNFYLWEHRHLYDEAELRWALEAAGFTGVTCHRSGEAASEPTRRLESRIDGSLVAQAVKPPAAPPYAS